MIKPMGRRLLNQDRTQNDFVKCPHSDSPLVRLQGCDKVDNMSRTQGARNFALLNIFSLLFCAPLAFCEPRPLNPSKKTMSSDEAIQGLINTRVKQVNQMNREIKSFYDLSPEEKLGMSKDRLPPPMTPEQIKKEELDAAKDPEDRVEIAEKDQAPEKQKPSDEQKPRSAPRSSGSGTAVPGSADQEMIVYPGRKKN